MYCMSSKVSEQRNSKKRLIRALNNDAEELSFVWQPETAGLDVPLSMKHDGAAYYYVTDGNKNVTALYDATGAEAANYVYGPFGQTLAANGRGGESPAAVDYEGGKVAAICNLLSCNGDEMHRPEDLDLDMLFCMELGGDSGIGSDGNASALRTVFGMEAMDRRQYGTSTTPALPPGGLALVNPFRFSSEFHDDELGLVYYNYRYYNPQLGRWTKRDPINGTSLKILNINIYCNNNPLNNIDKLGLWGEDVHKDATKRWMRQQGYLSDAADVVAEADNNVDSVVEGLGPWPYLGSQDYHFNRSNSGRDTRLIHFDEHMKNAKSYCNKFKGQRDHQKAAQELGTGLHPLQDWIAHADHCYLQQGAIWIAHNAMSRQTNLDGNPMYYPDRVDLDVKDSPDGRASISYLQTYEEVVYHQNVPPTRTLYDYAIYVRGTKRLNLTRRKTLEALKDFKKFLMSEQATMECRCYFLGHLE